MESPDSRNEVSTEVTEITFSTKGSAICARCTGDNFIRLLAGHTSIYTDLGALIDILECDCPLCQLVIEALSYNNPDEDPDFLLLAATDTSVHCVVSCSDSGRGIDGTKITVIVSGEETSGKKFNFYGYIRPYYKDYDLLSDTVLECTKQALEEDCIYPLARPVSNQEIDVSLIMSWLGWRNSTGKQQAAHSSSRAFPPILIDIRRNCLAINKDKNARYITLSYVRGDAEILEAKRDNLTQLLHPGSLSDRTDVPIVVKDAMRLVALLGEQYLWADSLCILTDDDRLQAYLDQMDQVYSRSVLTTVALGRDANCPLPGITPGSRPPSPQVRTIRGIRCLPMLPSLETILERSVHSTRGWTLQETIMAKKCLFISESQVFLQRGTRYQCEDTIGGDLEFPWVINPLVFQDHSGIGLSRFGFYSTLVAIYTRRNLTYETDICRAFAGVASMITRNRPGSNNIHGFVANLAKNDLLRALIWSPGNSCRRIKDPKGFPSWSWAGWIGPVSYGLLSAWRVTDSFDVRSCIYNPRLNSQRRIEELLHLQYKGPIHKGNCSADIQYDALDTMDRTAPLQSSYSTLLEFQAHQADASQFTYGHINRDQIISPGDFPIPVNFLPIQDRTTGRQCGVLVGVQGLENLDLSTSQYRIILLGVMQGDKKCWDKRILCEYYRDSQTWCAKSSSGPRYGCLYYILLIERRGDVFERVAVGQLHPEAWKAIESTVEVISLA